MGAVTDQLSEMLRGDFPIQLVIGWTVWAGGGLLLMLWFRRRGWTRAWRDTASPSAVRLSGTHAVARPASGVRAAPRPPSGTHAAARPSSAAVRQVTYGAPSGPPPRPVSGVRPPPSGVHAAASARIPDAYTELSLLLDTSNDPSQSGK